MLRPSDPCESVLETKVPRPPTTAAVDRPVAPPQVAPVGLNRTALSARLDALTRLKLTRVVGPPGSGKTTAVANWRQGIDPRRAVAWMRVDDRHDSVDRWCRAFLRAVAMANPGAATGTGPMPAAEAEGGVYRLSEWLLDASGASASELLVVIDGCEALRAPPLARLIGLLVTDSPPNLRWLFAGRQVDSFDTTALFLQGQLGTIDAEALRMDAAAVQQLARRLGQPALSKGAAEEIVALTEGWPAGVKFALSGRDGAGEGAVLRGDDIRLATYFAATALRGLTEPQRRFLVDTSVLEQMSGELCDALLGTDDGQTVLEALHAMQCFVVPLDGHGRCFRYQRLFREFLRARLETDAARVRRLHLRASRWFAAERRFDEALAHAFASGDDGWCAELLGECAAALRNAGDVAALVAWCERLPRAAVVGTAEIVVPYAFSLVALCRFEAATSALAEARASSAAPSADLDLLELFLAGLSDSDNLVDPVHFERGAGSVLDPFARGLFELVRAYALLRRHRYAVAWRCAMRASERFDGTSAYGFGQAQVVAVLAERAQCDFRASKKRCEHLYALASRGRRNAGWVNAAVVLAQLRYDENRIGEAEALCLEVLPLLHLGAALDHRVALLVTLARIDAASDRPEEAWGRLEGLHSQVEGQPHGRFLAQVCAEKIRLSLLFGKASRAHEVAAEFGLPALCDAGAWAASKPYDEAWERFGTAYATLLVHDGDPGTARALLTVLRDSAHHAGNAYRAMLLDAALAAVEWKSGHADAAFVSLDRALGRSHGMGFLRTAFDEVPTLGPLLGAAVDQRKLREPLPTRRLKRLDSMISASPQRLAPTLSRRRAEPQPEPLTQRELDLLRLIAQGMSNQQIGTQWGVAVSTVKWHGKNLYAKLDANSRVGALARARERRLIEP